MKTRLYTTDYAPSRGGVARYLEGLVRYFEGSVDVEVAPAGTRWWQAARWFVAHRGSYDQLLISHVLPIGTGAMIAKLITGKPYVVIVHGMDVGFAKRNIVKRFVAGLVLFCAKLVVTNSRSLEREVRETFGVSRTLVVYPCIYEISQGVAFPQSPGFLTVARLVPRKGHLRVLDAMAKIKSEHPDFSFSYTIVGDGPERDRIAARVLDLGLGEIVRIVTDVTDAQLPAIYAHANIFVMPVVADALDREGFGTVYLEAAVHGVPSIATRMPGVDEAVLDGKTGILVEDGNIAALADALYRLSTDSELCQRLGNAARDRAGKEFVPNVQFETLRSVIG